MLKLPNLPVFETLLSQVFSLLTSLFNIILCRFFFFFFFLGGGGGVSSAILTLFVIVVCACGNFGHVNALDCLDFAQGQKYQILFVCPSKILHKHCFQFLQENIKTMLMHTGLVSACVTLLFLVFFTTKEYYGIFDTG